MVITRKRKKGGQRENYPYASARVKARKSTLLPKSQYEKFLVMDLPSIIRYISETEYSKEVGEMGTRYSGLDLVEMATYENLARNFREVLGFCKGSLKASVELYLGTWDTWNIKTILRGRSYGASVQEIMDDMIPAGHMSRDVLRELVSTDDMESLIDKLKGTKFHKHLLEARTPGGEVDLMKFENALDREYYADLQGLAHDEGWVGMVVDRFVREKIDVVNLKTLFKLKFADLDHDYISSFMIPGGRVLSVPALKRLASMEDFEHMLNELKAYKFWPDIKDAAESATDSGTLNSVMSALDSSHFRNATKFGKLYPLSLLPFLDYFIWKKIEVDNIRVICRGKEAGLSEDLIRSMLIT